MIKRIFTALCAVLVLSSALAAGEYPKRIVFDTDIGSDVDDGLALSLIHAMIGRGELDLLAVTSTNASGLVPRYVRMLNAYFGRPDIPIGTPDMPAMLMDGNFMQLTLDALEARYVADPSVPPPAEPAVPLLRRVLAESPDRSVTVLTVGFATNLARLLDSPADEISPMTGRELIACKTDRLIIMAGTFSGRPADYVENNIRFDIDAARRVAGGWPVPIVWEGHEIGSSLLFPLDRLQRIFAADPDMPAYVSCRHFGIPTMALWDLAVPLFAVHPGYFRLSPPGRVAIREDGTCAFTPEENGRDRYIEPLTGEESDRILEAFGWLLSQPPRRNAD